jgi:hypothetical protein
MAIPQPYTPGVQKDVMVQGLWFGRVIRTHVRRRTNAATARLVHKRESLGVHTSRTWNTLPTAVVLYRDNPTERAVKTVKRAIMTTIILNTIDASNRGGRAFLRGMVSAFNLRGRTNSEYFLSESGGDADLTAIQNDWETVSDDLGAAIHATAK